MNTFFKALSCAVLLSTLLNTQTVFAEGITDSVTQANVKVVGTAPSMAMGNIYVSAAQSTTRCRLAAVAKCQDANENGTSLNADENGLIDVSLADQYSGISCSITDCVRGQPINLSVQPSDGL